MTKEIYIKDYDSTLNVSNLLKTLDKNKKYKIKGVRNAHICDPEKHDGFRCYFNEDRIETIDFTGEHYEVYPFMIVLEIIEVNDGGYTIEFANKDTSDFSIYKNSFIVKPNSNGNIIFKNGVTK